MVIFVRLPEIGKIGLIFAFLCRVVWGERVRFKRVLRAEKGPLEELGGF